MAEPFTVWQDETGKVQLCILDHDNGRASGTLTLLSDGEVPRTLQALFRHLLQLGGQCTVAEIEGDAIITAKHELLPNNYLVVAPGQRCIYENPNEEESVTMFQSDLSHTDFITALGSSFVRVDVHRAD